MKYYRPNLILKKRIFHFYAHPFFVVDVQKNTTQSTVVLFYLYLSVILLYFIPYGYTFSELIYLDNVHFNRYLCTVLNFVIKIFKDKKYHICWHFILNPY